MSDRDRAVARAKVLAAAKPDAARLEMDGGGRMRLVRGSAAFALRARPEALPLRAAAVQHAIAVGTLKAGAADRPAAFREIQRALREGGNLVYGEADLDGTFAKDHLVLREIGMVAAPMDTIPELAHVPWRLLAAFKPLTKSQAAAERGHETH